MKTYLADPISAERFDLGEGCRWDEVTQRVSWVDVFTGRLLEASWDGKSLVDITTVRVEGVLTSYAPLPDRSGWIVAENQAISLLGRSGQSLTLAEPEGGSNGRVRMNDAACDPRGRFWAGSMAFAATPRDGSLYRFDLDGSCTRTVPDLTISNGLGWSPDGSTMYHVDSGTATLFAYDYDLDRGELSAGRPLVVVAGGGVPDGLCVDRDGYLWVAIWGAGEVRRYSPGGEQVAAVEVAATQPSSCALGGPDGRQLFITTARDGVAEDVLAAQPHAGCLFSATVDVPGQPIEPFRGAVPEAWG